MLSDSKKRYTFLRDPLKIADTSANTIAFHQVRQIFQELRIGLTFQYRTNATRTFYFSNPPIFLKYTFREERFKLEYLYPVGDFLILGRRSTIWVSVTRTANSNQRLEYLGNGGTCRKGRRLGKLTRVDNQ